jgi:glutathione-regulated potassium-efflux system ancillary protein KefG
LFRLSTKNRILILFAHPALHKSRVNRVLIEAVRNLEGITYHDLYEAYPEFDIDVAYEQDLLTNNDIIIFQHPFFWYSTPAILKEWQDLVLEHDWAYGSHGNALRNKKLLNVTTTGGRESAYCAEGDNRYTMRQLLAPIEQTAALCGMEYLPPFVIHGTLAMTTDTIRRHAEDYRKVVEGLRDGTLDLEKARNYPRLNKDLNEILAPRGQPE